jgi:hypothetical protein
VRALLLAIACFVFTGLGVVLAIVPVVGAVFAFGAPALALLGVILGGLDLSQRKREGKPREAAMVGTVLSALGFFPALITALTCGVCNALVSAGPIEMRRGVSFQVGSGAATDGGLAPGWPRPSAPSAPEPATDPAPSGSEPSPPSTTAPSAPSGGRAAQDALPPPPLPAGPGALP